MSLEAVTIGQGVSYLDRYTFSDCLALKEVTIPATVTAIDEYAFSSCEISNVYYAGTAAQWDKIRGGGADYLKNYSEKVFFECTGPENAVPMTFEIKTDRRETDYFEFSVHADENGFQRVNIVRCYYDKNGKFLYVDIGQRVFPDTDNTCGAWYWSGEEQRPDSVKLIILDEQFRPLCPPAVGIFG